MCCSDSDLLNHKSEIEVALRQVVPSNFYICAFRAPLFTFWISKLERKINYGEIIAITRIKTDGSIVCGLYTRGVTDGIGGGVAGARGGEDFLAQFHRINASSFGELCTLIDQKHRGLRDVRFLVVYPPGAPMIHVHGQIEQSFHHSDVDRAQGAIIMALACMGQRVENYVRIEEQPREGLQPMAKLSTRKEIQEVHLPVVDDEIYEASYSTGSRNHKIIISIDIGTSTCKAALFYNNKTHLSK